MINRKEKRTLIRKAKGRKGLQKKSTVGAFGRLSQFEIEDRERILEQMAKNPRIMAKLREKREKQEIPENEKWLHDNPKALKSVKKGLNDAKNGRISPLIDDNGVI